jgi:hypothetical protein
MRAVVQDAHFVVASDGIGVCGYANIEGAIIDSTELEDCLYIAARIIITFDCFADGTIWAIYLRINTPSRSTTISSAPATTIMGQGVVHIEEFNNIRLPGNYIE